MTSRLPGTVSFRPRHLLDGVARQRLGVPLEPVEARGHDELRQAVHAVGKAFLVGHRRPGGSKMLVAPTPEEKSIRLLQDRERLVAHVGAEVRHRPLVLAVLVLLAARRLHDAVEGDELGDDHSCHALSFPLDGSGPNNR